MLRELDMLPSPGTMKKGPLDRATFGHCSPKEIMSKANTLVKHHRQQNDKYVIKEIIEIARTRN
jgi:hypothetical protein